jgi:hypothetical protein
LWLGQADGVAATGVILGRCAVALHLASFAVWAVDLVARIRHVRHTDPVTDRIGAVGDAVTVDVPALDRKPHAHVLADLTLAAVSVLCAGLRVVDADRLATAERVARLTMRRVRIIELAPQLTVLTVGTGHLVARIRNVRHADPLAVGWRAVDDAVIVPIETGFGPAIADHQLADLAVSAVGIRGAALRIRHADWRAITERVVHRARDVGVGRRADNLAVLAFGAVHVIAGVRDIRNADALAMGPGAVLTRATVDRLFRTTRRADLALTAVGVSPAAGRVGHTDGLAAAERVVWRTVDLEVGLEVAGHLAVLALAADHILARVNRTVNAETHAGWHRFAIFVTGAAVGRRAEAVDAR